MAGWTLGKYVGEEGGRKGSWSVGREEVLSPHPRWKRFPSKRTEKRGAEKSGSDYWVCL